MGSGLCAQLYAPSVALLHYYKQIAFEFIYYFFIRGFLVWFNISSFFRVFVALD